MTTVGLIVNPVAGLGGAVGLKGTDGPGAAALALARGAVPRAVERAAAALSTLARRVPGVRVVTAAGDLGEAAVRQAGVVAEIVYRPIVDGTAPPAGGAGLAATDRLRDASPGTAPNRRAVAAAAIDSAESAAVPRRRVAVTSGAAPDGSPVAGAAGAATVVPLPHQVASTAADTVAAVRAMWRADLILFAGGDGTARDLLSVVGEQVVLGIPAGVKMHSAVFAVNARSAGDVAASYLSGSAGAGFAEVLDRVEADGRPRTELFGRLRVPLAPAKVARGKLGSSAPGGDDPAGLAAWLTETRVTGGVDVFGPGTTTATVLARLGVTAEPTGVTVVAGASGVTADHPAVGGGATGRPAVTPDATRVLAADADAATVEALARDRPVRVVVSPIGGQGFLLGRGNQQLTPKLLRAAGRDGIVIISGEAKLAALGGRPLLVDTGDDEVDRMLSGYSPVRTGADRRIMYRIGAS